MPAFPAALRITVLCLLAAAIVAAETKAPLTGIPTLQPSANKGRRDDYKAETGMPGYAYNVCAKHIDPNEPAGIMVFFHGQGAHVESPWFPYAGNTLQPYKLIGINMAYADGDNAKDTAGKVQAARIAVGQVCADYKVVLGRGVMAGFSGGGLPMGLWWSTDGAKGPRDFPFNHVDLWSTNFRAGIGSTPKITWMVSVGTKEWALAALGATQVNAFAALVQASRKDKMIDHLLMTPEKDHTILDSEYAAGAEVFARSDVVFAPFLYEPDYAADRAAARIAAGANQQAVGDAYAAVEKALANPKLADADRPLMEDLKKRIGAKLEAKAALMERLATADPALAASYWPIVMPQLGRGDRAKAVGAAVAKAIRSPEGARAVKAQELFAGQFPGLLGGSPTVTATQQKALESIATAGPVTAATAVMAKAFAALPVSGN